MSDYFPIGIAAFGVLCGAVVNYIADILPLTRQLGRPRCLQCREPQAWFVYFVWPRRCHHCGKTRGWRTLVVELTLAAAALWVWAAPPDNISFFPSMMVLTYFTAVVVMDIEHRVILNPISIAGAILAGSIGAFAHGIGPTILGGLGGFGILFILYKFGAYFAAWMARRRGAAFDDVALGFGDVNLAGVIGLLMGWPGITAGLIVGVFAGGIVSFFYLVFMLLTRRYQAFATMPYGPFLVFGAVSLIFFRGIFGM